jgi:hypothetical protein
MLDVKLWTRKRLNMNPEHYKSIRNKPKRNSAFSRSKSGMVAKSKECTTYTSPKLCEIYSTKIEWAMKIIPKLKEK